MRNQNNVQKKVTSIKLRAHNSLPVNKKNDDWKMSVESFEKNGCMINAN